jgi:predicted amidophosphoribosyltransferase
LLKQLILQLKFGHRHDIAPWIAHRLQYLILTHPVLSQALSQHQLMLTYVPSHRYRHYRIKWYNQSKLLAQEIIKLLWIPLVSITTKIKHTRSQIHAWSRTHRLQNLHNAFILSKDIRIRWDETILIIDDITTTWSTIHEIAKTIKSDYPHVQIRALVVARHDQQ